ncbi:hypothetical protein EVG20_g2560 [Dentipellis fragilis]|uniref:Uncharacterized protein n=1 Tax=Dentipellis fragilis TaxID=205917 RepID=A0A4Y9ZAM4_9AGAM|nr:hypothetical protein EVG20_g2560 [Dentipellis fragilis]
MSDVETLDFEYDSVVAELFQQKEPPPNFKFVAEDPGPSNQDAKIAQSLIEDRHVLYPEVEITTAKRLFETGALSTSDYHTIVKRARRKQRLADRRVQCLAERRMRMDEEILDLEFMVDDLQASRGLTDAQAERLLKTPSDVRREWHKLLRLREARRRCKNMDPAYIQAVVRRYAAKIRKANEEGTTDWTYGE